MNTNLRLRILSAVITFVLLFPATLIQAQVSLPSPDRDADGLTNRMEEQGWYSLLGGPYLTDPDDADSDDDGLSDAEEKLFNTNPLNDRDPGIYVRYEEGLQTREYFSAADPEYLHANVAGGQYLMTEAMVVRRGSTFRLGGPWGAQLSITGAGLTPLSYWQDPVGSGWVVEAPNTSYGTVGTYTAILSKGVWSASMPIYVIFELPSNLTQAEVDAYIYDDDPADLRDEVSVWWRTPESSFSRKCDTNSPPCSNWDYHYALGYAQAFWTEQFTKKVFVDHTMQAIAGTVSPGQATNTISAWADQEFRVVFSETHNSWSSAMYKWFDGTGWTMEGGACQDNANVFTTLLRSAGIASRTFLKDYNKTPGHDEGGSFGNYEYDHSVLVWLDGHWKAARSYARNEEDDLYYPWDHGYIPHHEIVDRGYTDEVSDLIVTSNEKWDWQNGSNGGGMVNTVWDGGVPASEFNWPNQNWDYRWNSLYPLEIERTPYMEILNYESWYGDDWAPGEWRDPPVSDPESMAATSTYFLPPGIPSASDPLENWPYNPVPVGCSPTTPPSACQELLAANTIQSSLFTPDEMLDQVNPAYATAAYTAGRPEAVGALLSDTYDHQGVDKDGDGRYDQLLVEVGLEIKHPGSYQVSGELFDGKGQYIGHAEWIGSDEVAELQFEISKTVGPYWLERVMLVEVGGPFLDSRHVKAYEITDLEGRVDQGQLSLQREVVQAPTMLGVQTILPTNVFETQLEDADSDGRYDALVIQAEVQVTGTSGTYWIEGLLVDGAGKPVAWSVGQPEHLSVGTHSMALRFEGDLLWEHLPVGGAAESLELVGVKIFSGVPGAGVLEEEVPRATQTAPYERDQFESPGQVRVVYEDDGEAGTGDWSATAGVWNLVQEAAYSATHSWRAAVYWTETGLLSRVLDLSGYAGVLLRFRTAYSMDPDVDWGYVEASGDGASWTELGQYTDATPHWMTQVLDLSEFEKQGDVTLRFRAVGESELVWYVDDVQVLGWPAVNDVTFGYTGLPLLTGEVVPFEGSYSSLDPSEPVTYTWTFGDGGPAEVSPNASIGHVFDLPGIYTVQLRVENTYDSGVYSETVQVYQPVQETGFEYEPVAVSNDWTVLLTGSYAPTNANKPVTYTWAFGDGSGSMETQGAEMTHTFSLSGTYSIVLTTTNGYGEAQRASARVSFPLDSDGDGIPNSVEGDQDIDGDGVPNYLDRDSDEDGIPDSIEVGDDPSQPVDSEGDGVPDYLDEDSDGDGIPDSVEAGADPTQPVDSDGDTLPDYRDEDSDHDGILDAGEWSTGEDDPLVGCNGTELDPVCFDNDADGDGTPNYADTDSDGDGIPDSVEAGADPTHPVDSDKDGIPDYLDSDSDGDGIPDSVEAGADPSHPVHSDDDGTPDYLDEDSDDDGILDSVEAGADPTKPVDSDGDKLPDYRDNDSDHDGIQDAGEWSTGENDPLLGCSGAELDPICFNNDVDGDGISNYVDNDSDGDGISDSVEAGADPAHPMDSDEDGIPDYLDSLREGMEVRALLPVVLTPLHVSVEAPSQDIWRAGR